MWKKQICLLLGSIIKFFILHIKFYKKLSFGFFTGISMKSTFEGANRIYPHSYFRGHMGYGSYIGPNCTIIANIGRFTSIAPYVRVNSGIHPYEAPFSSTSPMFFSRVKQNGKTFANRNVFDEIRTKLVIGNDCWIGENVFIAGGLNIGDGAVVLAGAVVTKDVPAYSVVGGMPAKVIKYRYDAETISFLLDYKWWNKDIKWLEANWELLNNIEELKKVAK